MAKGIKISQLDEFTNSDGSEYLTAVKAGVTKKIQIQNIAVSALGVSYDNTISGLSANNVKAAIDELESIKISNTEKGSINGVASLDGSGKIITSQLPAIAIVDTFVVANQTEQLALVAQQGDIAIRSDETKSYVQNGGSVGDMTDWTWLQTPAGDVLSVNGETGVVTGLEEVINRQNTLTDDDSKYPSSGAVVDYLNTHIAAASAHHDSLSDGLDITPNTVFCRRTTVGQSAYGAWITGDTSARYYVKADGTIEWGPGGASARDTNLYRHAANQLRTNDAFGSERGAGNACFFTLRTGDPGWRWYNDVDGVMTWGSGDATYDTNLYRSGANALKTDDNFYVGSLAYITTAGLFSTAGTGYRILGTDDGAFYKQDATTTDGFFIYSDITGEGYARFAINNSGAIEWGPGSGARDVNLYRYNTTILATDADIYSTRGSIFLGADVNIYRGAANQLKTDDNLYVGGGRIDVYSDVYMQRNGTDQIGLGTGDSWHVGTAANYRHGTTSRFMVINSSELKVDSGSPLTFFEGGAYPYSSMDCPAGSSSYRGNVGLHFGNGSTITDIQVYGRTYSGSTNNWVEVQIWRVPYGNGSRTQLSYIKFENGASSGQDVAINEVVDYTSYWYYLEVRLGTQTGYTPSKFFTARIQYASTNVGQSM